MIVYASTKSGFIDDVASNRIADKILALVHKRLNHSVSNNEIRSWKNSMQYMHTLLVHSGVPVDAGVAIEYNIPQTSKRVDFILTGQDDADRPTAIIIELKQWEEVWPTGMDGIVTTILQGAKVNTNHPSFQAWSYAALLEDFNEIVQTDHIRLNPCAYLHNCSSFHVINDPFYRDYTNRAPAFLKTESDKLKSFIEKYVRKGDQGKLIYRIDGGRIRPSKSLADALEKMLNGNPEFLLIDNQKLVYETALALADKAERGKKQVLIVEGGPGTGKSVVAINLLVELIKRDKVVHYVTKNAAPRAVYQSKLTGSFTKSRFDNLFKGSGAYTKTDMNAIDVLVVDEAHRLNEKSGIFQQGENQIKEIIHTARLSIFFIDESQRVTWKDAGRKQDIVGWAEKANADVMELGLLSQFRCNGSDGYLSWVDHSLQIRNTATTSLEDINFDFRVFDDPNDMRHLIEEKNLENNKARMVAGYCWDWVTQKTKIGTDVNIPAYNFSMRWNLKDDGGLWIIKPESVKEIGCIHTCQGLEVDYIGVIIGPDLIVRNGEIITDAAQRSKNDSSVKGYKKLLKENPAEAKQRAALIIKNTYRTLMTRGQKGCYIYCTDLETNEYFKTMAKAVIYEEEQAGLAEVIDSEEETRSEEYPGLTLRLLKSEEVKPYENAVPIFDLKIAAGQFSEEQQIEDYDWVELPDSFRPQQGHFVTRVVGESMNRRIPNGAWCLFKANPGGSRNGKIVIVQQRDIQDPDTGESFTIKRYHSEKVIHGDSWHHKRIVLEPESNINTYEPIELDNEKSTELKVIGELIAVLS